MSEVAERRNPSCRRRARHQLDLGQVEPLAEQVDPHQHVELAAAQVGEMAVRSRVSTSEWR